MFIILLFICAVFASFLVYPLWIFATHYQTPYSYAVSASLLVLLFYILVRQIRKHGIKAFLRFFIRLFITVTGLFSSVYLVLSGKRLLAAFALVLSLILFIVFSHFLKLSVKELSNERQ